MSGRLGRPVYWPLAALAALALWALALTLSPSAALAQQQSAVPPSDASTAVVDPGDSLWSIAQERLGPRASAGRVAKEAERIYELNEALIGPDPNTIVVGQELALPPRGGPSAAAPARERGAVREAAATEAPATRPPAPGKAAAPSLPAAPKVALVVPAGSVNPGSPKSLAGTARSVAAAVVAAPRMVAEPGAGLADERRRLGLSIIALTLLVGALMTRTLPMRRQVGWWVPDAAYVGAYSAAYAGFYGRPEAHGEVSGPDARAKPQPTTSVAETEPEARWPESAAPAKAKHARERLGRVEAVGAARRRSLRRRGPWAGLAGAKRRPPRRAAARGGTATGAHGPKVRRYLPPAGAKTRTRLPRPRGETYAAGFLKSRGVRR